jgi:itaconyl-CoA hydratase
VRLFEDFAVGDVYPSAVARTVTETDNLLFTMLAMNTNELHFNEEAARASEWGKPLVNSTFTLALVLGLSVRDTTEAGGVNLGWTEIRLPKPVFVGDTIRSETEVLSARISASRPTHGIVQVRTWGLNQRDEIVCEFERSFLIARKVPGTGTVPGT